MAKRILRHRFQPRSDGCGITCIAMVTGLSYDAALELIFPCRPKRRNHEVNYYDMVSALQRAGLDPRPGRSFRHAGFAAIMGYHWDWPYEGGHYIVYNPRSQLILCPCDGILSQRRRNCITQMWFSSGCETILLD